MLGLGSVLIDTSNDLFLLVIINQDQTLLLLLLSELSSDFENINATWCYRTVLGEGLCPFVEGFWTLYVCL